MHPSPAALIDMSTDDLDAYVKDLRRSWHDSPDDSMFNPLWTRIKLIDTILEDRRHAQGSVLETEAIEAAPKFSAVVTDVNEDGSPAYTFTPWTDGHAVGFKVTRHAGIGPGLREVTEATSYVYLNPSTETFNDGGFSPDAFVYTGADGDPAGNDYPHHFYNIEFGDEARTAEDHKADEITAWALAHGVATLDWDHDAAALDLLHSYGARLGIPVPTGDEYQRAVLHHFDPERVPDFPLTSPE